MTHPALIERITRSLAYMLRHQPDQFDLELDEYGYGDLDDVVQALNERLGEPVEVEDLTEAVESGDRIRYEIKNGKIRALYGHSIDVQAGEPSRPPELLYVGLSRNDAERALRFGLRAGRRRYLHLALTRDDAFDTASRDSGDAAVLAVHALDAWEQGVNFFDRSALFLSDPIPTQFLELLDRAQAPRRDADERDERDEGDEGDGEASEDAGEAPRAESTDSERGGARDDGSRRGRRGRRRRGGRGGERPPAHVEGGSTAREPAGEYPSEGLGEPELEHSGEESAARPFGGERDDRPRGGGRHEGSRRGGGQDRDRHERGGRPNPERHEPARDGGGRERVHEMERPQRGFARSERESHGGHEHGRGARSDRHARPDRAGGAPRDRETSAGGRDDGSRHSEVRDRHPEHRDRGAHHRDRGPEHRDRGPEHRDRDPHHRDRHPEHRDRGPEQRDRHPEHRDRGPEQRDRHPENRDRQPEHRDRGPAPRDRGPDRSERRDRDEGFDAPRREERRPAPAGRDGHGGRGERVRSDGGGFGVGVDESEHAAAPRREAPPPPPPRPEARVPARPRDDDGSDFGAGL